MRDNLSLPHFRTFLDQYQAVEFSMNPLDVDVTGHVVVYFRGLQNDTVDTKSTREDVIIERIRAKFHNLINTNAMRVSLQPYLAWNPHLVTLQKSLGQTSRAV